MAVVISKLVNGILFDTSSLPGSGDKFAKKKFVPQDFGNIADILLYDDRVVANDANGNSYSLNLTGEGSAYPVSEIDSSPITSIENLFTTFITIL